MAFPDCERSAPICGADVIGATSLTDAPAGVAVGAQTTLTVTAGDACQFQPRALYIAAYEFQAATAIANSTRLPLLMLAANVGNVSMLRRLGTNAAGIITDPYNPGRLERFQLGQRAKPHHDVLEHQRRHRPHLRGHLGRQPFRLIRIPEPQGRPR
jgi:hypothetical protein